MHGTAACARDRRGGLGCVGAAFWTRQSRPAPAVRVVVTPTERRALIDRYAHGHQAVLEALSGATDAELDARPAEGWSAREVVHHLADSEMTSAIRLRRLLV